MNNQEQTNSIERISVASDGSQANGQSGSSSLSNDGTIVLFESNATNLVPNDFNQETDIFIYNRDDKSVELISIATDGSAANGSSSLGTLSDNAQYLTFSSSASNLVPNDNNNQRDIFIYDRLNKTTNLVSVANDGTQSNELSFFSAVDNTGRYVVFESAADNLVPVDTNNINDIFLRDRVNQTITRINVAQDGTQADGSVHLNGMSDNGQYIVFSSTASNLVSGDTNDHNDIFVYDRIAQTTRQISVASDGTQANSDSFSGSISGDGRYVSYQSSASNLVPNDTNNQSDVFIYDLETSTTERVSLANDGTQSNGASRNASVSDDGNYVAFLSEADNLVFGDTNNRANIFIRDRQGETTIKIEGDSFPTLSGNSETLLFNSSLSNLVTGDTNDTGDVFIQDLELNDFQVNPLDRFTTDQVHRFYQFEKGFHFYTSDDVEAQYVQEQSAAGELSYNYEGEKFTVLANDKDALTGETLAGVEPVYRFFNTETGAHLYTIDENEKDFVIDNLANYNFEGIKYYAFESAPTGIETIPVFRMLNNDSGSHLYSIDQNELDYIDANLPNFSWENNSNAVFHVFEL